MAEIRHVQNGCDIIFSAQGVPIWIKCRRLLQNDMSTAMMWSKSKPGVEFQCGGHFGEFNGMSSQSHLPQCRLLCSPELVSDILSKSEHPGQKKMMSRPFSTWRISAILDFRGPIMSSLKSPGTTSYRSSIDTIALNGLVF